MSRLGGTKRLFDWTRRVKESLERAKPAAAILNDATNHFVCMIQKYPVSERGAFVRKAKRATIQTPIRSPATNQQGLSINLVFFF